MITEEQWQEVEAALGLAFCSVRFQLGDTEISLVREPVDECRRWILVYIDGTINHNWGNPRSDQFRNITDQIWRQRSSSLYKPAERAKLIREYGKRGAKRYFPGLNEVARWNEPFFPKFSPLKKKLQKLPGLTVKTCDYQALINGR